MFLLHFFAYAALFFLDPTAISGAPCGFIRDGLCLEAANPNVNVFPGAELDSLGRGHTEASCRKACASYYGCGAFNLGKAGTEAEGSCYLYKEGSENVCTTKVGSEHSWTLHAVNECDVFKKCGMRQIPALPSVVNGGNATRGAWPWQILLLRDGEAHCGGTLISEEWVVSAAHCFDEVGDVRRYAVRVGELDRNVVEGSEVTIPVAKLIVHERWLGVWYGPKLLNDITLVKLASKVKFNDFVQPACLPTHDTIVGDRSCYITGWGKIKDPVDGSKGKPSRYLQEGNMPPLENKVCEARNKPFLMIGISPKMVCAGADSKHPISGCHGDSGGPFVCDNGDDGWQLHGVVSFGSAHCNAKEAFSVFTRVYEYTSWIREKIRQDALHTINVVLKSIRNI